MANKIMGFCFKYLTLFSLVIFFCVSLFFSCYSLVDVLADVNHYNYTTRIHYEDLVVEDNASVVFVPLDSGPPGDPVPGYHLYWEIMAPVSRWYESHVYQVIKLTILTVSLLNLLTTSLCLLSQSLYSCGLSPSFWLCHPTPLLLVELSLTVTIVQTLAMILLGRLSGLMLFSDLVKISVYFLTLMVLSYLVGDLYQREKKQAEEKLVEYETVNEEESSDSEIEETIISVTSSQP